MGKSRTRKASSASRDFPSDPKELLTRVKQVHEQLLQRQEQKEEGVMDRELNHLASQLVRPVVLQASNKTVKQLAARSLVHLLFLYAPELPFGDSQLKDVFWFLTQHLKGLSQEPGSPAFDCAFYILEKLAVCKIGCVLIDVTDQRKDAHKADDVIVALFDTIFDAITPQHGHQVEGFAVEVLASLVEEHDSISPKLLDALLSRLLPERRKESQRAYDVAKKTVARCADRLREPISAFVNNAITGGEFALLGADGEEAAMSELRDHIHDLIYELYVVDPSLLLYILPNVANQLEVDELDVRSAAVQLMCLIFHSSNVDFVRDNTNIWETFLKRIGDKEFTIRHEVVKFVGFMIAEHADKLAFSRFFLQCKKLDSDDHLLGKPLLQQALEDPEDTVRDEAVVCVSDAILVKGSVNLCDERLLRALADRLHDKQIEIAINAAEALAKAYVNAVIEVTITRALDDQDSDDHDDHPPTSTSSSECLTHVPDALFRSYFNQFNDLEAKKFRLVLCKILDEHFLPSSMPTHTRAIVLSEIWASLSVTGRKGFRRLVCEQRQLAQKWMLAFVDQRASFRGSVKGLPASERSRKESLFKEQAEKLLVHQTGEEFLFGKSADGLRGLVQHKDEKVFNGLRTLCGVSATQTAMEATLKDVCERLGSKTNTARALKNLMPRMTMRTATQDDLTGLVDHIKSASEDIFAPDATTGADVLCKTTDKLAVVLDLVATLIEYYPTLVSCEEVVDRLTWFVEAVVLCEKRAFAAASSRDKQTKSHRRRSSASTATNSQQQTTASLWRSLARDLAKCLCKIAKLSRTNVVDGFHAECTMLQQEIIRACLESDVTMQSSVVKKLMRTVLVLDDSAEDSAVNYDQVLEKFGAKVLFHVSSTSPSDLEQECVALSVMFVLMKHRPSLFSSYSSTDNATKKFDTSFLVQYCLSMVRSAYPDLGAEESSEDEERHESTVGQLLVQRKVLGVKIIAAELIRRREVDDVDLPATKQSRQLMMLLRKIVGDGGNPWDRESERKKLREDATPRPPTAAARWPPGEEDRYAKLRLAAACEVLRITSSEACSTLLMEGENRYQAVMKRAQRWVELSWVAMDPCDFVRDSFGDKLLKHVLLKGKQPFFYGVLLVLVVGYDAKGKHETYAKLVQFLKTLCRKYNSLKRRAMDSGREDEQSAFARFAPECMLPNLLYLLAQHPAFPKDREMAHDFLLAPEKQRMLVRPIFTLMDALEAAYKDGSSGTNAGFLFAILNAMRQKVDIMDPYCDNIHMLGDLASEIMRKKIKFSSENLAYPGDIPLPPVFTNPSRDQPQKNKSPMGLGGTPQSNSKRRKSVETYLPDGFELVFGGSKSKHPSATTPGLTPRTGSSTARKRRTGVTSTGTSKRRKSRGKASSSAKKRPAKLSLSPVRRQPRRASKPGKEFKGYMDVDKSDDDDVTMHTSDGDSSSPEMESDMEDLDASRKSLTKQFQEEGDVEKEADRPNDDDDNNSDVSEDEDTSRASRKRGRKRTSTRRAPTSSKKDKENASSNTTSRRRTSKSVDRSQSRRRSRSSTRAVR